MFFDLDAHERPFFGFFAQLHGPEFCDSSRVGDGIEGQKHFSGCAQVRNQDGPGPGNGKCTCQESSESFAIRLGDATASVFATRDCVWVVAVRIDAQHE